MNTKAPNGADIRGGCRPKCIEDTYDRAREIMEGFTALITSSDESLTANLCKNCGRSARDSCGNCEIANRIQQMNDWHDYFFSGPIERLSKIKEEFIRAQRAARALGLDECAIVVDIGSGYLPGRYEGGSYMVNRAALVNMLKSELRGRP